MSGATFTIRADLRLICLRLSLVCLKRQNILFHLILHGMSWDFKILLGVHTPNRCIFRVCHDPSFGSWWFFLLYMVAWGTVWRFEVWRSESTHCIPLWDSGRVFQVGLWFSAEYTCSHNQVTVCSFVKTLNVNWLTPKIHWY